MDGLTQQITLTVAGMGCGGCAAKLEKLLGQTDGVRMAAVSFPLAAAVVEYDPALTDHTQLVSLLMEAGHAVSFPEAPGASRG